MTEKWGSLPRDILDRIVNLLNTSEFDILRVRAVCSWWRSLIPLSKQSPFRLSIPITPDDSCSTPPFVLAQNTTLRISPLSNEDDMFSLPATPWVIQVVETGANKLSILDLFSQKHDCYFPKHPNLPEHLSLLDYNVTEINRSYILFQRRTSQGSDSIISEKAIVITHNISLNTAEKCFKVFFVYEGHLAFWEYGMNEWALIRDIDDVYHDIIRYKDRIYVVDYYGRLTVIDLSSCNILYIEQCLGAVSLYDPSQVYCMAEYNGQLYLITYDKGSTSRGVNRLSVYVLDEEEVAWKGSSNLGGGIFFVYHESIKCVVSPKDVGRRCGNIVYIDGVSNYYGPDEVGSLALWQPCQKLFWPPPRWISR